MGLLGFAINQPIGLFREIACPHCGQYLLFQKMVICPSPNKHTNQPTKNPNVFSPTIPKLWSVDHLQVACRELAGHMVLLLGEVEEMGEGAKVQNALDDLLKGKSTYWIKGS